VADNSPIARHPTATGNLESFTRLNECLGDDALIEELKIPAENLKSSFSGVKRLFRYLIKGLDRVLRRPRAADPGM
jgi:hypothetical protein